MTQMDEAELQPLTFDHPDSERRAKEAFVRALPEADIRRLYDRTHAAAVEARRAGDMERLYRLVRGTKAIQRIAGERGIIIRARRGGYG